MKSKSGIAGLTTQPYRPASDFDNDTLTHKREYWRNKKREQRARLAERRRSRLKQEGRGERQQAGDVCASQTSGCKATTTSPVQKKSLGHVAVPLASLSETTAVHGAGDPSQSQKERWFQTMKLNQVLPPFTESGHTANSTSAFDNDSVKCQSTGGTVGGYITSPRSRSSGNTLDISAPSVPPNRVTLHPSGTAAACQLQSKMSTKGSSSKATPHPGVLRQGVPLSKAQHKAQVACIQPKPLNVDITTGLKIVSPTRLVSFKAERSGVANVAGQVGMKKSALVTSKRGKSVDKPRVTVSEEERAAKRREQWRIKKREQRAKLAAGSIKRETQRTETTLQRPITQKTGLLHRGGLKYLPSLSSVRSMGQKQSVYTPKALDTPAGRLLKNNQLMVDSSTMPRHASTAVKKEEIQNEQSGPAMLDTVESNQNQNRVFIKVENPQVVKKAALVPNVTVEKKVEYTRKFSNYMYFSNVSRGIARCRTPRQRFIETQKCFSNQRNIRVKFPTHGTIYNSRNVPKIHPNESPEQTASRRREYWRIKKREQRAKQSLEVKNRLKEKDSLMRRVKRYQKILEEMRKARAQTLALEVSQPTGSMLTHASETIGGFIKEDGTVTINIPQVHTDTTVAERVAEQTSCLLSNNDIIAHSQNQPHVESLGHHRNVALGDLGRLSQRPPPPLHPAKVRVSLPQDAQSANKPPRLLSVRPRTQFQRAAVANSNTLVVRHPAQITLTHPPFPMDSGSEGSSTGVSGGGCVMKMAVSSLLAAPCEDPELTQEQRMAKKREYWRVKKREQRAARAAKLKQGLSHVWGNAAMQRRKTHKLTPIQRAAMTNTQSGNVAKQKVNILPSPNVNVPNPQQAKQIKVEGEPAPAADLNIPPEQAICPIKLSPSPLPPLALPQPEPDPTLSAETQATTLLAVASMKKLLEESLSTVTECQPTNIKTEQPPCQTEIEDHIAENHLEQEMKSNTPMISLGEDKLPLAANLTLQIKSWQADPDDLVHACSQDPYLEASTQTGKSPPPLCSTTQDLQCSSAEDTGCRTPTLSPLRRAKRLCTKKSSNHHHHCCAPEPPKLHHSPTEQQSQLQKVQPTSQPPRRLPQSPPPALKEQCKRSLTGESVGVEGSVSSIGSLQNKREYWKLMKRQQRARSKARQKGSLSHRQNSRLLSPNTVQSMNLLSINNAQSGKSQSTLNKRVLQPKVPTATLTAVHSIPTLLVVSPTASNVGRSPDMLQVKPPVCSFTSSPSRGQNEVNAQPSGTSCDPDASTCSRTAEGKVGVPVSDGVLDSKMHLVEKQPEVMQGSSVDCFRVRQWTVQDNINVAPALATLTPPDNPLSSINLLPIEPLIPTLGCKSSNSSPVKPTQPPKPKTEQASPTKLLPISTLAPPKPIPGESQEEFLRRKREYWRVKKKEQRARKAIRDRELSQRRAPGNWKPIRPAKDQDQPPHTVKQDPGHWVTACEESERQMSSTSDAEMGYYSCSSYAAPIEDEDPDTCFTDTGVLFADADHGEEDLSVSDGAWRTRYLMDHDPLNQLLVCMVCGDLLYSHSLEAVRAHIEEAHPDTLNLEPPECRRILDAWDEQVSQRERFFTSQLQQHGATLAEANGT